MTHLINRTFNHDYPTIASGTGIRLVDTNGKRYFDASGGAAVSSIGHGHPKVVAANKKQVDEAAYAHTSFFVSQPSEDLADFLVERAPEGFGRVAFVSGGSEAVEAALKLTRQVHIERGEPNRSHFIARGQSYHGGTLGMIALAGPRPTRTLVEPMFGDSLSMSHIPPCYAYRHKREDESETDYGLRVARALEEEILRVGPEKVAGFVAETVSGSSLGCAPPTPGYFKEIRRICDKYGVLLIVDEVMSGMGRTGHLFAITEDGVSPDVIAIAKGLGGGYQPIGAVLMRDEHYAPLAEGSGTLKWTHTYMAHPTACAAALAVQQVIEEEGLLENCRARGAELKERLQQRLGQHPHVGDIRGRGLFIAIELVADRTTKAPFKRALKVAETYKKKAMANGMLCYPSGGSADTMDGDHVMLAPPLIITAEEINELVDLVERTLADTVAAIDKAGKSS
jgi:adenosylmethionine-8-amino-7-oxononanoate aminotransferase